MRKQRRPDSQRGSLLWLLAVVWLFSALHLAAQGVVLHLRNGDKLTGTIKTEDTNRVVLTTTWGEALSVPVNEIVQREPIGVAAQVPQTNVVAAVPAVSPAQPAPATPPVTAKHPKRWSGEAQLGADLLFSARKQQLYTGRIKVTYVEHRFRNLFDYLFAYGRTDGFISANRMDGSAKTDFDVLDRFYVYNLAGAGYDEIRRIDIRYDIGPGLGYHLLRWTNVVVNIESGVNYQAQYLADGTETELFYHRFAEDFAWKLSPRFSLDEKFEYFPQVGNWGSYRFRFETNLRYFLRNNLYVNLTLIDQYDTRSARAVNQNDLQVRSSLGLKF